MKDEELRNELYKKINEWFSEANQRPIVDFMIDTMMPYILAAQKETEEWTVRAVNQMQYADKLAKILGRVRDDMGWQ